MKTITLAIETSVRKTSLALLVERTLLDEWSDADSLPTSEILLLQIKHLLSRNSLVLKDVRQIAVSTGPGSFTGLRIGVASAKALGIGLGCPVLGITKLEALTEAVEINGNIITIVGAGQGMVAYQIFKKNKDLEILTSPKLVNLNDYFLETESLGDIGTLNITEPLVYEQLKQFADIEHSVVYEENIAKLIGLRSLSKTDQSDSAVIDSLLYMRDAIGNVLR